MLDFLRTPLVTPAVKRSRHLHKAACWFPSCPTRACQEAQKLAAEHGFTPAGEIALPHRKVFPWEQSH